MTRWTEAQQISTDAGIHEIADMPGEDTRPTVARVRMMDQEDRYPAGYGYPAGLWEINYMGPLHPVSIQGFPNRNTAVRYATEVCGFVLTH